MGAGVFRGVEAAEVLAAFGSSSAPELEPLLCRDAGGGALGRCEGRGVALSLLVPPPFLTV